METLDINLRFESNKTNKVIADAYHKLAIFMNSLEIESREKTIAMEKLEESYMWATKGFYGLPED